MEKTLIVVILAHGIFGWGEESSETQMRHYYFGIKPYLEQVFAAHPEVQVVIEAPTVPAAESVERRGAALKEQIEAILNRFPPGTRAHIVAHSMGGLDSRWVLAQEGMADRITSLTTIATPHRGTTLGDLAYDELPIIRSAGSVLEGLAKCRRWIWRNLPFTRAAREDELEFYHHLLGNLMSTPKEQVERGLYALTLTGADEFNKKYADAERRVRERKDKPVAYFAYGAGSQPDQIPLLKPSFHIMDLFGTAEERTCKEKSCNDGAVSVWSAHFPWDDAGRDYVRTIPFDHFMQINWRIPEKRPSPALNEDLKAVYREIAERIIRLARPS